MQNSKGSLLLQMQFKKKNNEKNNTEREQTEIGSVFQQGGGQGKAEMS